jgi:hypothetical protein
LQGWDSLLPTSKFAATPVRAQEKTIATSVRGAQPSKTAKAGAASSGAIAALKNQRWASPQESELAMRKTPSDPKALGIEKS